MKAKFKSKHMNLAWIALKARNEKLAAIVDDLTVAEVSAAIERLNILSVAVRGKKEKVPKGTKFNGQVIAELFSLSKKEIKIWIRRKEESIADLQQYLADLENPERINIEAILSLNEFRYCDAEAIPPAEFLIRKINAKNHQVSRFV